MRLKPAVAVLCGVLTWLLLCLSAGAASNDLEYAVKAAYLYKFAPFVEWPQDAFDSPMAPVHLCIVGRNQFSDNLEHAVSSQMIGARPMVLDRSETLPMGVHCHILFAGGSDGQSVAQILEAVHGTPTLTITDAAANPQDQGIIEFVIDANRVRFDIDDQAAADNRLIISSKLLGLAHSVKARSQP